MPDRKQVSARAKRVWKRLAEFYGARIAEQYGALPPQSWCEAIDAASDTAIQAALVSLRLKHLNFPPTLPEFEAELLAARPPAVASKTHDVREDLADFVLRHRSLTPAQLASPWTWLGRFFDAPGHDGKMRKDWGVEYTGVVIPADGDHPGYRVMVVDMLAEAA